MSSFGSSDGSLSDEDSETSGSGLSDCESVDPDSPGGASPRVGNKRMKREKRAKRKARLKDSAEYEVMTLTGNVTLDLATSIADRKACFKDAGDASGSLTFGQYVSGASDDERSPGRASTPFAKPETPPATADVSTEADFPEPRVEPPPEKKRCVCDRGLSPLGLCIFCQRHPCQADSKAGVAALQTVPLWFSSPAPPPPKQRSRQWGGMSFRQALQKAREELEVEVHDEDDDTRDVATQTIPQSKAYTDSIPEEEEDSTAPQIKVQMSVAKEEKERPSTFSVKFRPAGDVDLVQNVKTKPVLNVVKAAPKPKGQNIMDLLSGMDSRKPAPPVRVLKENIEEALLDALTQRFHGVPGQPTILGMKPQQKQRPEAVDRRGRKIVAGPILSQFVKAELEPVKQVEEVPERDPLPLLPERPKPAEKLKRTAKRVSTQRRIGQKLAKVESMLKEKEKQAASKDKETQNSIQEKALENEVALAKRNSILLGL